MNNQNITGMGLAPSIELLEEQVILHQKQIRAIHFEIAKRQMQLTSQSTAVSTDAIEDVKSPNQICSFGQQSADQGSFGQQNFVEGSNFGQQSVHQGSFGSTQVNSFEQPGAFGQQNVVNTQVKSSEHPGTGQSLNNKVFEQKNKRQNTFGHPSQSSMCFGQTNTFESNQNQKQKGSFGHPSQNSFTQQTPQQKQVSFQQVTAAPAVLKPDGRMLNKSGNFLGRVQAAASEGCVVSIKRLGKLKFFDYKTVDECLKEWEQQ